MEVNELVSRPPEKEIYKKLWDTQDYRAVAPGEHCVSEFLMQARPEAGSSVLDLGCGTGRASLLLALPPPMGANLNVTMVDFADNCLDADIRDMLEAQKHALRFVEADLTKEIPITTSYGFCTDVMEHIPPEGVNRVLNNCLMACQHIFFQISTVDDVLGGLVGHPLHLTVRPYEWWLQKFNERKCLVHWSKDFGSHCMFYVSAWTSGAAVQESGKLNIAEEKARSNVSFNIAQDWKQVEPHDTNDFECMILGGGPSLSQFEDDIRAHRARGVKLITLNNTYNWCLERGLTPSATIIVDAREHNARFSHPVVDDCRYLICSQCDPTVLEGLPKDRTYLWHTGAELHHDILNLAYDKKWWWVPGGSTVLLRGIPLLRLLGYRKFHLYGCDSCAMDGVHHAYEQKENDVDVMLPTSVSVRGAPSGRIFMTSIWQASQAHEFLDLVKLLGNEIELEVYGDGLLAYLLKVGSEIEEVDFVKES